MHRQWGVMVHKRHHRQWMLCDGPYCLMGLTMCYAQTGNATYNSHHLTTSSEDQRNGHNHEQCLRHRAPSITPLTLYTPWPIQWVSPCVLQYSCIVQGHNIALSHRQQSTPIIRSSVLIDHRHTTRRPLPQKGPETNVPNIRRVMMYQLKMNCCLIVNH